MILVVDSGSTKSDWVLLSDTEQQFFSTMGLNPYFHSEEIVFNAVCENEGLNQIRTAIEHVFFYGAGCSSEALNQIIVTGLQKAFPKAKILVDHDLKACAYATYEGSPSISCIIGTGSNSCYFDGNEVSEVVPALGYVLGDEGSGTYFGKQLLSNYLYKRLPNNIQQAFYDETKLTKDQIVDSVYMQPNANVYLASFMPFIVKFASDSYIKDMVFKGFKQFIDVHVCCYPNYKDVKVHFVGSIAALFHDELKAACEIFEVNLGNTIQKPIDGLVRFHEEHIIEKIN
ncbi:MAG: hypothetical protein RIT10_1841 [Bacteroidota bacterium]|jgi:N-acetylglucosamine kinase-like BadF-type ATPase